MPVPPVRRRPSPEMKRGGRRYKDLSRRLDRLADVLGVLAVLARSGRTKRVRGTARGRGGRRLVDGALPAE